MAVTERGIARQEYMHLYYKRRRHTESWEVKKAQDRRRKREHGARLAALKLETGCQVCGARPAVQHLHFHHRDPQTKEFNVSTDVRSKSKTQKELEKCVVLCPKCHYGTHAEMRKG